MRVAVLDIRNDADVEKVAIEGKANGVMVALLPLIEGPRSLVAVCADFPGGEGNNTSVVGARRSESECLLANVHIARAGNPQGGSRCIG